MKRKSLPIILISLFSLIHIVSFGQRLKPKNASWYDEKLLHFGFSLGLNTMDFNITPSQKYLAQDSLYPSMSVLYPGINIQIVTNLHLAKYFDIRFLPGVSFGQRVVRYYKVDPVTKVSVLYNENQRLESSFLEFPLLLKYKGDRLNNVRPYVIGGLNFRYDLAGKKEYDDSKLIYLRIKRPDLYYEVGAGLDFYLPYFKLSMELKMSNGFSDIIIRDEGSKQPQYLNAIEKMKSQIWILAFHFE